MLIQSRYQVRRTRLLAVYGSAHFLVDAACASVVFGLGWLHALPPRDLFMAAVAYNVFAFAFQPLCGMLSDRMRAPSATAAFGIFLTGIGVLTGGYNPWLAVGLSGLGNAFFHVAGGAVALMVSPGRATAPGLYVAPGALGIALGALIGKFGPIPTVPIECILVAALISVLLLKTPSYDFALPERRAAVPKWPRTGFITRGVGPSLSEKSNAAKREAALLEYNKAIQRDKGSAFCSQAKPENSYETSSIAIAACLLASIMVRSLVGFSAPVPWKSDTTVLFIIVCAAFAGKALGGIIADRFGWNTTVTAALLLSAPLLAFGFLHPAMTVAGMLLFQMTMPVTLAALYRLLPEKPSLAFGLTCLALIIGAAPVFSPLKHYFIAWYAILPLVLLAAAMMYAALRTYGMAVFKSQVLVPRETSGTCNNTTTMVFSTNT